MTEERRHKANSLAESIRSKKIDIRSIEVATQHVSCSVRFNEGCSIRLTQRTQNVVTNLLLRALKLELKELERQFEEC